MYSLIIITRKIQNLFCSFSLVSIFLLFGLILPPQVGQAQISITSLDTYSQDFNSLPRYVLGSWNNYTTLPGWVVSAENPFLIVANDGSRSTNGLYSFGPITFFGLAPADADRSLGGINSSGTDYYYGVHFKNNTGAPIRHFTISYTLEQWRRGSGNAESLSFDYLVGTNLSIHSNSNSWKPEPQLNATAPSTGGNPGARNGNVERVEKSFTLYNVNLASGQEIIFRWKDPKGTYALAINDVEITPLDQIAYPAQKVFFPKSVTNLHVLSNWGINPDGTGPQPVNFTDPEQTFYFNRYPSGASIKLSESWTVSGENSKVVIGNGQSEVTFVIPYNRSFTGVIDVVDNATLTIDNAKLPTLGDLAPTSTVIFEKKGPSEIDGRAYGNLTLKSGKAIKLKNSTRVMGILNLSNTLLILDDNDLTIDLGGNVTGASAASFVANGKGALKMPVKAGTGEVVFPVGSGSYNPVRIKQAAGSKDDVFSVKVAEGVYVTYQNNIPSLITRVLNKAVNKAWIIDEEVKGGSNISLTVAWEATDILPGFDPTNCHIKHFENNVWDTSFSGIATLNGSNYEITRTGITSFSPFGAFSDDPQLLPVELLYFHASAAANAVHLEWATASEANNDFFAVEKSTDGTSFHEVAQVKGASNTTAKTIYTAIDKAPFAGTSYYRLKQADHDGKVTYSPMQVVSVKRQDQLLLSIYPNPAQNAPVNLRVEGLDAEHPVEVKVTDIMGRNLLHKSFRADAAALDASLINAGDLNPGTYIVTISSGHRSQTQRLLIK